MLFVLLRSARGAWRPWFAVRGTQHAAVGDDHLGSQVRKVQYCAVLGAQCAYAGDVHARSAAVL